MSNYTLIAEAILDGKANPAFAVDPHAFDNYGPAGSGYEPQLETLLVFIDASESNLDVQCGYLQTGGDASPRITVKGGLHASFKITVPAERSLQIDASGAGGKAGGSQVAGGHCHYKVWIKD